MREIFTTGWDRLNNPYIMEYRDSMEKPSRFGVSQFKDRGFCIKKYGFAIPTEDALFKVQKYAYGNGLIELGAGTGYWASFLRRILCGDDQVIAIDPAPVGTGKSAYSFSKSWTWVDEGDHTALTRIPEAEKKALFMSWPDYDEDWPAQALEMYRGPTFIYIGEGSYGCTGNDRFHQILHKDWKMVDDEEIPQWPGIHDRLEFYQRKTEADRIQEASLI